MNVASRLRQWAPRSASCRLLLVCLFATLPATLHAQPVGPDEAITNALAWENTHAADVLSNVVVSSALALPCVLDRSWQCVKRESLTVGIAMGVTEILKRTIRRDRPNHRDRLSFPSGHTAATCAAVLSAEYQKQLFALCPSVAYFRIASRNHHTTDTIFSFALSAALSW